MARRRDPRDAAAPQLDDAAAPQLDDAAAPQLDDAPPSAAAPAAAPADRVLALQRSAGNAAVTRAIVARDVPALADPGKVNLGLPGLGLGGPIMPAPIPEKVESKVKAWLEARKFGIGIKVQEGTISMPEVVADIRKEVPEALEIEPWQLEGLVSEVMGRETPPPTRGKRTAGGAESEIAARIANALPKPPKSISFSSSAGRIELSLDGLEASTKAGGAKVTAKGGTEEGEVTVKKGPASVTATAGYKGDSFGLKTQVGDVSFHAKVEKENDSFGKWSMKLTVPLLGKPADPRPMAGELKEAVEKANAAVSSVIAHIQAGGKPTDDVVKKQLEAIKPAIDAVGKATEQVKGPSVTVGVKAEGGSSGWSAGVTLVIEF